MYSKNFGACLLYEMLQFNWFCSHFSYFTPSVILLFCRRKVHCLVKYMSLSFGWSFFKWFFSGVGDSCGFDNFPSFGIEAFTNTYVLNILFFSVSFSTNLSMWLSSVLWLVAISYGWLWDVFHLSRCYIYHLFVISPFLSPGTICDHKTYSFR